MVLLILCFGEDMNIVRYFRDFYDRIHGKYVPSYDRKGRLKPVCNYCHNPVGMHAIFYRPRRMVFDTEACRNAMLDGNGASSSEIKDLEMIVKLADMKSLTQPHRGDVAPKNFNK